MQHELWRRQLLCTWSMNYGEDSSCALEVWTMEKTVPMHMQHELLRRQFLCTCSMNYGEDNSCALAAWSTENAVYMQHKLLSNSCACAALFALQEQTSPKTVNLKQSVIQLYQYQQMKLFSSAVYCCCVLTATHFHLLTSNYQHMWFVPKVSVLIFLCTNW